MADVELGQDLFVSEKIYADGRDSVSISRNTLDLNALISSARSPRLAMCITLIMCNSTIRKLTFLSTSLFSAGAVSSFFGTTRDTFEGKDVTHLEYEAYPEMALASMLDICARVSLYRTLPLLYRIVMALSIQTRPENSGRC